MTDAKIAEKARCHWLHIDRARQGFTVCVDCRRPLFTMRREKCARHCLWFCTERFSETELTALRGFEFKHEDQYEDEED
jgi:hypothetical protein